MSRIQGRRLGWLVGALLVAGVGATAFVLIGAAEQGNDVLSIDVAAYLIDGLSWEHNDYPVYLIIAVTSPIRGGVDQLRKANIKLYDPMHGPGGWYDHQEDVEVTVQEVRNLGGGFYQISIEPGRLWVKAQYALQLEVVCPWGRGITVFELPMKLALD